MSLPTASYSQVLPPTSPSHAVACQLTPKDQHLVTARDDTLQVWSVSSSSSSSSPRLVHLLTKPFFGTITGLLSTSTLESEQDGCQRLLVSFRDAKLALLEWNERAEDLETISIHTYERTPQVAAGLGPHFRPILSKDPEGRCATLLLPQDSLAVLPLISSSDLALLDDESDDGDNIYGGGGDGPSYSSPDNENARRPPYIPSFVLPLSEVDANIRNVRDVVFLPSFQKPTCAVLCEPHQPAWTGSLATRRDTLHVYIFTLDLTSTTHPVLSHVEELPYDALYLVAGPPSLGGVFVVTPSVLFHVDQSGRMVGVRVNGWAEMTSANKEVLGMPLYDGGEQLDLCDSHIAWIEGMDVPLVDAGTRAKPPPGSGLLVLKDGRVMSLRCELDGRTLSSLSLQPVSIEAEMPLPSPSAVVTLEHSNSIFVASMLGESSLVGVKGKRVAKEKGEDDEMDSKPAQQSAGMDLDDEDEDLYGDSKPEASTSTAAAASSSSNTHLSYTLTPLDSMPGLGPISDLTLAVLPDEAGSGTDIIRLVATHGVEPHAGLVHLEDVIQPRGRRAVHLHDANSGGREGMAIPALDDVKRVTRGRFLGVNPLVGTPTLYAIDGEGRAEVLMEFFEGNVKAVGWLGVDEATGSERYLVVAQDAVFVRSAGQDGDEEEARTKLAGTAKQVVLGLDEQSGAVITVAARLDDGRVQVFVVDATGGVHQIALLDDQDYLRVALFVDESGTFSSPSAAAPPASGSSTRSRPPANAADEEDEVDYGDEDMQPASTSAPSAAVPDPSHHLAVITSSGGLELFTLSTSHGAQRQWRSNSILDLPAQLEPLEEDEPVITCSEAVDVEADVDDLWIGVLGEDDDDSASHATLCIAMTERSGLLNVWSAAAATSSKPAPDSSLVFNKKLARQLDGQEEDGSAGGADDYGAALPPNGEITARIPHRLVATQGAGRDGRRLFVTGPAKTGWLVNPRKGKLHFFESAHRRVRGLAAFSSNIDEEDDEDDASSSTAIARYIIADTYGLALHLFPPPTLRYDLSLPYTLPTTTHRQYTHIRPFPPLRSLVTSSISRTQFVQFDTEDMSIVRPLEYDPSPAYSMRGALELFRGDWAQPVDGFEFEQNETVSAMELVTLHSASSRTGLKDFIAVGTSVFNGEDRPTRGAMYIFDIIETVPNPQDPTPGTNARLKLLVKDDARGPVTALGDISGYLAVSIGQRLFIRAFEKHEVLINVAFLDVGFLSTSLRRLGSTLLISDVRRAVLFAGFQEEPFRLTIFGRQFPGVEGEQAGGGYVCAAEYLVSEGGLNFLAADWRGVLRLLEYPAAKAVAEASDAANAGAGANANAGGGSAGSRLLLRTEFQTSATEFTASLSRAPRELLYGAAAAAAAAGEDAATSSTSTSLAMRNEVLLSTSSGSLVMVRPLSTSSHHAASSFAAANSAASLSNAMQRSIPHSAALPPRGARIVPNKASAAARPLNRGLLDGGVLQGEWLEGCSRVKREELTGLVRGMGTKGGVEGGEGGEMNSRSDGDGRGEERLRRGVADLFS